MKFFQNEIAAYVGDKSKLRNVNFKRRNLENSAGAEQGTLLEIIPIHIRNPPVIQFIAYLTSLDDSFALKTQSKAPYGRTEPYYIWQGNDRTITIGVSIPNSSADIALDNLNNMSWFAASLYPTYKERMSANSIAASPLFRVRYANLVSSVAGGGQGILCVIAGVNYKFNIKQGYIAIDSTREHRLLIKDAGFDQVATSGDKLLIPKDISFQLKLNVIHDHAVGWDYETGAWRGGQAAPGFPYGFGLTRDVKDLPSPDGSLGTSADASNPGNPEPLPGSPQSVMDQSAADSFFESNKENLSDQSGMSVEELEKLRAS